MKRIQPVILLLAAMTLFLFYRQSHRQSFTEGITRAQIGTHAGMDRM